MSFTVRLDSEFFGKQNVANEKIGDIYRSSLEGSSIMLRMLIEFLGIKSKLDSGNPVLGKNCDRRDIYLGKGELKNISAVEVISLCDEIKDLIARMHYEASKRTAHPTFHSFSNGLDPKELREATKWVINQIWEKCYKPDSISIHPHLYDQLEDGRWEGIPFEPSAS
jgi:hypothetical protein